MHAGSVCELPGYIDEHHRRSGFLQRGNSSSPPTHHLSLQILLHNLHSLASQNYQKHLTASVVPPSRIRGCNSRIRYLPSPLHITQFLELS
ncbi:unnamed protein product [Sphagnum balticum]